MPFNFLLIFALLNLAFARTCHATLTKEELYWKSVFPDTPMPKFLQDTLPRPGSMKESRGHHHAGAAQNNKWGDEAGLLDFMDQYERETQGHNHAPRELDEGYNSAYNSKYDPDQNYAPPDDGYFNFDFIYNPESGNKQSSRRQSNYANVSAIKENIYFFRETLFPGKKLNLPRLTERSNKALFLPQQIVKLMPMSSDKLLEILKNFSLKTESIYANEIRMTIKHCERAETIGEEKYCATSLESFVDLSVSMLGRNIRLLSHQLGIGLINPLFTIGKGMRNMGDKNIICHKMMYPYAVYLCHSINKTIVYEVPLVSVDGTKANAVAVCHKDTSAWSPDHISFKFLNIKPGSVPICHVVARDTVVWVPN